MFAALPSKLFQSRTWLVRRRRRTSRPCQTRGQLREFPNFERRKARSNLRFAGAWDSGLSATATVGAARIMALSSPTKIGRDRLKNEATARIIIFPRREVTSPYTCASDTVNDPWCAALTPSRSAHGSPLEDPHAGLLAAGGPGTAPFLNVANRRSPPPLEASSPAARHRDDERHTADMVTSDFSNPPVW